MCELTNDATTIDQSTSNTKSHASHYNEAKPFQRNERKKKITIIIIICSSSKQYSLPISCKSKHLIGCMVGRRPIDSRIISSGYLRQFLCLSFTSSRSRFESFFRFFFFLFAFVCIANSFYALFVYSLFHYFHYVVMSLSIFVRLYDHRGLGFCCCLCAAWIKFHSTSATIDVNLLIIFLLIFNYRTVQQNARQTNALNAKKIKIKDKK